MTAVDARFAVLDEAPAEVLLCSSRRMAMLDHFRVPYQVDPDLVVDGTERLHVPGCGPALFWRRDMVAAPVAATVPGTDGRAPVPLFVRLLSDQDVEPLLVELGGTWHRARTLTAADGTVVGSIWRSDEGSVFLPFDPNEVVESFWTESYLRAAPGTKVRALRKVLRLAYYRIRPLLPRPLQIWMRRQFAHVQARSTFPRWPAETCLHDFFDLIFAILSEISGGPVPRIAAWPNGHEWALVLTHDVEQAEGLAAVGPVVDLERGHGLRSSWNLVPRRYEIDAECVANLSAAGFEIGVHGLYHDGRDLESLALWRERLPEAYEAADRWGATGFRSAALHRHSDWMRSLRFDYDSSWPDTDPYEPQEGGCCSWLPFFNGEILELPVTLPQDHTLFVILDQQDESMWVDKAEFLRHHGGLALIDTHPDYLIEEQVFNSYARFLERYAADPTAWKVLPRDVAAWWRRRAASWLEHDGTTWQVVGPAADEARVVYEEGTW